MTTIDRRSLFAAGAAALSAGSLGAVPRTQDDARPIAGLRTRFAANVEMWWGGVPFLDRIRRAADLGFPAIELWPWKGKDLDGIARVCEETGVAVAQFTAWGFRPGLNDPANHGAFVAAIEEACDVAERLGAKHATVIAGDDREGVSQAEMLAQVEAGLRRAAPLAEERDLTLILEPMNIRVDHKGHCLYGSPDAVRICRAIASSHVKINWDLYHMQITEGDLCGRLREGFDQVGYVQLADHPGRYEPGTGEVHYNRVLKELHDLGYRGFVGLECRPRDGERTAAARVAAADVWS